MPSAPRGSCALYRTVRPRIAVVARTYEYSGERACDGRMSVFLKSIEAAHSAEGQGFAGVSVGVGESVWW